jgi:acyl-CoA synthetase (AMP-forming)/AMP-acid ligase II
VTIAIMDPSEPAAAGRREIVAQGARLDDRLLEAGRGTAQAWWTAGSTPATSAGWTRGYLFITGRTKDLIIRGGENISPGEIEAVLEQHPKIEEAVVIGVPDVEWGEEVKAIVVLKPGEIATPDEIIQYAKSRLASFKAPKYVAFAQELPRNYLGKVLKTDLRKLYGTPTS